jgi:hypothetical protein|tara:strand:- start:845 stop:979 length:135 start_codon:yes stop_codon:yes gene_type:complete
MRILLVLTLVAGCGTMQDNTTVGDKIIIGGSLLALGLFAGYSSK